MPAIIPFIPLIAAGVSAGVPLIENAVNAPPDPNKALQEEIAAQQKANQAQAALQTKEAAVTQAPSIQAQLGGSVAPDYYISQTAAETGSAGQENTVREALSGFLGITPPTEGTGAPGSLSASGGTLASGTGTPTPASPRGSETSFDELFSKYFPGSAGGSGGTTDTGTSGAYV